MLLRHTSIGDFLWRRMIALSVIDVPTPSRRGSAHASGVDPHRVLLFGEGPVTSIGLIDHELGLAGHLARALPAFTSRGADVDVRSSPALSLLQARSELESVALESYDAVVLSVGAVDVARYSSRAQWRAGLLELIELVERRTSPTTEVIVVGIRNVVPGKESGVPFARTFRHHADRLNEMTQELVAELSRVDYVDLGEHVDWRGAYPGWADTIAGLLGPAIASARDAGAVARSARELPQPEPTRQAALDRMAVLDTPADPRIDSIVSLARTRYDAQFAVVELIDRDRAWHKSAVGLPMGEVPRDETFCATTIERAGALVVGDARVDARFQSLPMVRSGEVRFYAGYPIEAPDGSRIGTLCVADGAARSAAEVDVSGLRDLALMVQRRLRVPPVSSFGAAAAGVTGAGVAAAPEVGGALVPASGLRAASPVV
jgi:hypothetical protein